MSAASSGQVPAEIEQRISSAVAARNYLAALADLETYQRSNPSEFESNNYGYLRARLAEKVGDQATAMREYQGVVQRHSLLEAHAFGTCQYFAIYRYPRLGTYLSAASDRFFSEESRAAGGHSPPCTELF